MDTEATVLRRFMNILTTVFSSQNNISLTEGETTSSSTKMVQQMNVALHEVGSGQSFGRKIDVLVKHHRGSNKYIELSSLEIKPDHCGPALVREQQNKNLRTNGAILANLSCLDPENAALQTTAAIDIVGSTGYVYVLTNFDDIFFACQVGIIRLPKSRGNFASMVGTLDILFAFEAMMENLGEEAQAAFERAESRDNICEVADVREEGTSYPHINHDIFITPTRHR
ncbi:hypothetical protein BCR43DRAFT_264914 [Syncephalastrum racemosum]|uniref:Uncharacterized protein n=1 Tax=Syncephalastrum racemosum TaxID=13706 RepID=A0A1X2HH18_SYNRA|nr:hypothetical protein BCR43DRAFT_264914 [Syncephalastrum racemosum]